MCLKTYDFFLTKPDAKSHEGAEHSHSVTLNCELAVNDFFSGKVLENYADKYVRYYFKVVLIQEDSVYYYRAFKESRPIVKAIKIPLVAIHTKYTGFILRNAILSRKIKFRRTTITRKSCRHSPCHAA